MLEIGKLYRLDRAATLYDKISQPDDSNYYKHIYALEKNSLCVLLEINDTRQWHTKNHIAKILTSDGVIGWVILSCSNPSPFTPLI